jgi:hypothetical protein
VGDADTGLFQETQGDNDIDFASGGTLAATLDSTQLILTGVYKAPAGTAAAPSYTFTADPDTGIWNAANKINFSTGGTNRALIYSEGMVVNNDLHVKRELDAQTGFFYTALHIGGYDPTVAGGAGNAEMFKFKSDSSVLSQVLVLECNPSIIDSSNNTMNQAITSWVDLRSQLRVGRNITNVNRSSTLEPFIDISPTQTNTSTSTFQRFMAIMSAPTLGYNTTGPIYNAMLSDATITCTTGAASASQINTFLCSDETIQATSTVGVVPMQSFMAQPTINASSGATHAARAKNSSLTADHCSFLSNPSFTTTNASTAYQLDGAAAFRSFPSLSPIASTTATLDTYVDLDIRASSFTGAGTEVITRRDNIFLENDTNPLETRGIHSTISKTSGGKIRHFLYHTGGADSIHTGDFYIRSGIFSQYADFSQLNVKPGNPFNINVPEDAYAATWNGSTQVPTKNAVYDKIEAVTAGANITFKESQAGGRSQSDNTLVFDSDHFYISSSGSGDPLVSFRKHTQFITFFSPATTTLPIWTNMPAALTLAFSGLSIQHSHSVWVDLSEFTEWRLQGGCATVAGFAGSVMGLLHDRGGKGTYYGLDNGTAATMSTVTVACTTGMKITPWTTIHPSNRVDGMIRLHGQGGDGIVDPDFKMFVLSLR